jgi:hypothetical protein
VSSSVAPTFVETPECSRVTLQTWRWWRYRRELAGFVIDILCILVSERATGRLTMDISEGSVSSVEFTQKMELADPS